MQPAQMDKLKLLLAQSKILDSSERESWLRLLPLMNDKQLSELEQILRPGPMAPPPQQGAPVPQNLPPRPMAAPQLSHLTNLPSSFAPQAPQSFPPRPQPKPEPRPEPKPAPQSPPRPAPRPTPPNNLAVDIREKELPPAHMADSEHLLAAKTVSTPPPVPAKPLAQPSPQPRPAAPIPQTPVTLASPPLSLSKNSFSHIIGRPEHLTAMQAPKPPVPPLPPLRPAVAPPSAQAASPAQPKAPVQFQAPASVQPPAQKAKTEPLAVGALADLQTIGIETFHAVGQPALIKKFRDMVKQAGYFDVLFAFEQSPLFSDYVATGKTLLEENTTFQGTAPIRNSRGMTLLSKDDFEAVADLLRQIQINS